MPKVYRRYGKRITDLLIASLTLAAVCPVMLVAGIVVRVRLGSPVFFTQQRPGRHGEPFRIVKFRTMLDARDANGKLLPDDQRLTPLGSFLRRSSLDELPELFNVLKGDMSLVGPRPLLTKYLPHFTEAERARFDVRPGITGWAQVNGRNDLTWDDRFACDVWYVENHSFWLDLKILALTVVRVIRQQNVEVAPALTLPDLDEARSQPPETNG